MAKSGKTPNTAARLKPANRPKPPLPKKKLPKPGLERDLSLKPQYKGAKYLAAGKLSGMRALITGGDSGIGRSVAVLFAREGADIAINYLPEEEVDANLTKRHVEAEGRKCILIPGDLKDADFCRELVELTVDKLNGIDILVCNAAFQNRTNEIESITSLQWETTFRTNIDAIFFITRAAMPHLKRGSSIIVTSSETGLFGSKKLLDYSSTKGAINAFVKALAQNVVDKGIRVNAVAPGPVWTPLNAADTGHKKKELAQFGGKTLMKRPAQPDEIAPAYVFFASEADSSFITGHVLPILGGDTATG